MSRQIIVHDLAEEGELKVSKEALDRLTMWLYNELEETFSSKAPIESLWVELLRQYEGVPKTAIKNYPIENAPNIEVTLGAIAADSIFAQAMDLKWMQTNQLLTIRSVGNKKEDQKRARALQRFVNWMAETQIRARQEDEISTLDAVQLGTGIFYIPWVENLKKTRVARVTSFGPVMYSVPPEDFFLPGGSQGDIENASWVAIRFYLDQLEFKERAERNGWEQEGAQKIATKSWMRTRREMLSRDQESARSQSELYDVFDVYAYYDIDEDGQREDLYIVYNHTGRKILKVAYNPYDYRPFSVIRYQLRPHIFWGIGVLEMMQPYQEEVTDIHNERNANMILANCRHWIAREGAVPANMRFRPNKITLVPDPSTDLRAVTMADVYPSSHNAEMMTMMLAERRVGVNEMSMPRPSSIMGSRTPGITALSLLQQVNRRFTPAFDAMRQGLAQAIKQALFRYQERVLAMDMRVYSMIRNVMGEEDGSLILAILADQNFDEQYTMELTASSVSINREADRQNAIMLINVLSQYYERAMNLVAVATNPQVPEPVRKTALDIAQKAGEIVERTVATFDQIRDPRTFVVDLGEELEAAQTVAPQLLQALAQTTSPLGEEVPGLRPVELPGTVVPEEGISGELA